MVRMSIVEIKILLMGYPKSKAISSFSSYLIDRYYKGGADIVYLNYGKRPQLFGGHAYERLIRRTWNTSIAWSSQLRSTIPKLVSGNLLILGLDDYFLSKKFNQVAHRNLLTCISETQDCVGAKLGLWTSFDTSTTVPIGNDLYRVAKDAAWPVTTQFTIWKKDFLMDYLKDLETPWDFEMKGASYLNQSSKYIIGSYKPALSYPEPSAISRRHPKKISVFANQEVDIEFGIRNGILKESSLILGQWKGYSPPYEKKENSHWSALRYCSKTEYEYNYNLLKECLGPKRER